MRVFLTGSNGVMGRAAMAELVGAGHEVVGLVRRPGAAAVVEAHGALPFFGDVFDPISLREGIDGCDAVVNFATRIPIGANAYRPGSLTAVNRLRLEGAGIVVDAAAEAGARRFVQQSLSFIYQDRGDEWIDESTPVDVTHVTEALIVAEEHARRIEAVGGTAVCLRYGLIVGDDRNTRYTMRRARRRRPFALGDPDGWMHAIHPDDIGTSVVSALTAPSGHYNVGAAPLTRREYADLVARAVGRERGDFLADWVVDLGGDKLELLTRSQRVSSELFAERTGWKPRRPELTVEWFPTDD
ncbi:NAD-dependent epimerase/dehydratase family protein [Aeromicrobium camelliae]|uniref:NAD-dependent epimerase/dehydratase family protein n=1 Tax=Aeromicrobium camelliae TaxID=1538144 RepID=A0A3N6X6Q7_9ACTN|nr:NAD(P)H-binding protein [Aeromicrobium camelliae]RQN09795.1 NAD-dependent epimerase/dehydratase family protein [Aeromicrobium camelliae]